MHVGGDANDGGGESEDGGELHCDGLWDLKNCNAVSRSNALKTVRGLYGRDLRSCLNYKEI